MAEWNQCFYCGVALTKSNATVDHFEAKNFGGEKMVASCHPCNNSKGHETVEWFREFSGRVLFYGELRGWKPW